MSSLCSTQDWKTSLLPALTCQGQEEHLFHSRDHSLPHASNALWHLLSPTLFLCEAKKWDPLRQVHSILTRKTYCTISITVPLLVTLTFHTLQFLSALKSAAGGSSQMSVTVTDEKLLHCFDMK